MKFKNNRFLLNFSKIRKGNSTVLVSQIERKFKKQSNFVTCLYSCL